MTQPDWSKTSKRINQKREKVRPAASPFAVGMTNSYAQAGDAFTPVTIWNPAAIRAFRG